jgi:actin-related protein 10
MAATPSTPSRRVASSHAPTTPHAAVGSSPVAARVAGAHIQASPHYTTARRHSLYGIEDRVVLDPGSRIWKVGFSGEGRPRAVFYAGGESQMHPLWTLRRATAPVEREEDERLLEARLKAKLRFVFHEYAISVVVIL